MNNVVLLTIITIAVLAAVLAVVLYVVSVRFKVEEDPRIDDVEKTLPGANCGGCGFAGCRAFAENAVKNSLSDGAYCNVGGADCMKKIASILGVEAAAKTPQVAVLRCNGCKEFRPVTTSFDGPVSCAVKASVYAGDTGCGFGCLGCGDCVKACTFGAITMNEATGLPEFNEEKCTACGACTKACPKGLIELRNKGPRGMRVFVSCRNMDKGVIAKKACASACIGCGKCAKVCAHEAITVENNLAYIDYTKCKLCKKCVAECPTGAIHAVNFPVIKKKEETANE